MPRVYNSSFCVLSLQVQCGVAGLSLRGGMYFRLNVPRTEVDEFNTQSSDSGGQKLGHFVGVNGTTDVVGLWNSARQCMPATKAKLG